jgi:hypothetical protein
MINSKTALLNRNSESMMFEVRITMQMFTRLFVTRIVASSESTSSSSERMALSRASGFTLISCKLRGVSEKNATSDPDTVAEISNNKHVTPNIRATCIVIP